MELIYSKRSQSFIQVVSHNTWKHSPITYSTPLHCQCSYCHHHHHRSSCGEPAGTSHTSLLPAHLPACQSCLLCFSYASTASSSPAPIESGKRRRGKTQYPHAQSTSGTGRWNGAEASGSRHHRKRHLSNHSSHGCYRAQPMSKQHLSLGANPYFILHCRTGCPPTMDAWGLACLPPLQLLPIINKCIWGWGESHRWKFLYYSSQ